MAGALRDFLQRKQKTVAIEIGTDLVKIFQLSRLGKGQEERLLKIIPIAEIGVQGGALGALLGELDIKNDHVVTYLPRNIVTLHLWEVPSTDPEELEEIVNLQGVKQTPYSREELAITHTVIGSRRKGHSDVVLAFCQRKFVNERVDLLERAGLRVDEIGISTEGLVECVMKARQDEALPIPEKMFVILDTDTAFSDLAFCRDGQLIFSRSISGGLREAQSNFEIWTDTLVAEVVRAIELTTEELQLAAPERMMLVGMKGVGAEGGQQRFKQQLEEKTGLPVDWVQPLPEDLMPDLSEAASVAALVGYAFRKGKVLFNLMLRERKLKSALEAKGKQLMTTGGLALGFLAVITLFFAGTFYKKGVELSALEQEIKKTRGVAEEIEQKTARLALLQHRKNENISFLNYIEEIVGTTPPEIYFNAIDFKMDEELRLSGYASEMSVVFNFVKSLESLKVFKGVKSERVSKEKVGEDILAQFEIVCRL